MPDWSSSMKQTYEYFVVDPNTWKDKTKLTSVISSSIRRDSTSDTLGSASITITEALEECYIRIYLVTEQNGVKERFALGTYLAQTPQRSFDGKYDQIDIQCYTPLIELKENPIDSGYYVAKNNNIMLSAYRIAREHMRAPVIKAVSENTLKDNFVANQEDTWLSFITDLASNDKYTIDLDPNGQMLFKPVQEFSAMQPTWTYSDDNSSILSPTISTTKDFYGIPNVVEITYSDNTRYFHSRVENNDPNSPTSIQRRGRVIIHRENNPNTFGEPTQENLDRYAETMLKKLSAIQCSMSYSHGYCPVKVGDCVRMNYRRAGIVNVRALVVSQDIMCTPGTNVSETAVFTMNTWR